MKRDADVIRKIIISANDAEDIVRSVEGIEADIFKYHVLLLKEAGLVVAKVQPSGRSPSPVPANAIVMRLTWDGYEYYEAIKDDTLWSKAKEKVIKPTTGWTFTTLTQWLQAEILKGLPSLQ